MGHRIDQVVHLSLRGRHPYRGDCLIFLVFVQFWIFIYLLSSMYFYLFTFIDVFFYFHLRIFIFLFSSMYFLFIYFHRCIFIQFIYLFTPMKRLHRICFYTAQFDKRTTILPTHFCSSLHRTIKCVLFVLCRHKLQIPQNLPHSIITPLHFSVCFYFIYYFCHGCLGIAIGCVFLYG